MTEQTKPITATECHDLQKMLEKDLIRFEALGRAKNVIQRLGQALQVEGELQTRIAALREEEAARAAELQTATSNAGNIVAQANLEAARIIDEAKTQALAAADQARANAQADIDALSAQITAKQNELIELSTRADRVKALLS